MQSQPSTSALPSTSSLAPRPPSEARQLPLPPNTFYSVEYPGFVRPTSVPQAVRNLGGQSSLENAFKRSATKEETLVELRLRPDNPFSHPIPGDVAATNCILLKVVKKKRKRRPGQNGGTDAIIGEYKTEAVGVIPKTVRFRTMVDFQYQPDMNDPISKLRVAMDNMDVDSLRAYRMPPEKAEYMVTSDRPTMPLNADIDPQLTGTSQPLPPPPLSTYQLPPPPPLPSTFEMNIDPQLMNPVPIEGSQPPLHSPLQSNFEQEAFAMNIDPQLMDVSQGPQAPLPIPLPSTSLANTGPAYKSNLRLFPPPLFSRQTIPQGYNFKGNVTSLVSTIVDEETGEEKKRLINKMRWKGYGPATIAFADSIVPDKAPPTVEEVKNQVDQKLLRRLQESFAQRPIWTRMALLNQYAPLETREILNSKVLLPLVCYVFQDGPWRDTLVRFNYDPRKEPNARFYQRLYFRNANHPIARPSVITRRQDRAAATNSSVEQAPNKNIDRGNSHIFDGRTISKETAAFQLCDIEDPMLKEMIESADDLRETCNERDGWYSTHSFERIKTVLRHKFFSLLEGHLPTDEDCRALLAASENSTTKKSIANRTVKLRAGKHNMAKGALRPEDAAALRLRATLDRNAKNFHSPRP